MPPPRKHGQAAGTDQVHQEGAASPLQGLQKRRSDCGSGNAGIDVKIYKPSNKRGSGFVLFFFLSVLKFSAVKSRSARATATA